MSARVARPAGRILLLLMFVVADPLEGAARQESTRPDSVVRRDRPRVGLVLGGGGARGFAHVGVLRALHEARIPVDLVVGTSAGALVGGFYASGVPLEEIERLFANRDWPRLFDDEPSRPLAPLRRKRDERELLIGLEVGIGPRGPRLPSGLIVGGELLLLLQSNTLHTRELEVFDALPLPFRAIATDIATGERVILDRGSLALAMRASLSVPGVFAPVRVDGRELVDGGIVDNLPIRVARDLGAEVVIAVDVGSTLDEDPGPSAIDYADRALTIMIRRATADAIATLTERDWLILPVLENVRSTSFTSGAYERAVRAGRRAVEALRDRWPELAVDEGRFGAWNAERTVTWRSNSRLEVDFVRADARRTALGESVIAGLFTYQPGELFGAREFAREMGHVLGYGGFSEVSLDFEGDDGRTGITLRPVDKPWGPTFVQSGLLLADRQRGRALWGLRAYLWNGRLNGWGGEVRARVHVGTQQLLGVEWYQPLHPAGHLFAGALAEVRREDELVPREDGTVEGLDVEEVAAELAGGVRLGSWGETRLGVRLSRLDAERAAGAGTGLPDATELASFFARFEVDILDRPAFPSQGLLLRSELRTAREFLIGEDNFERLAIDALFALSRGSHTVLLGAEAGTALGDTLRLGRDFQLGGLFRLSAAERGSLRGSYSGLGRLIYYLRPGAPASRSEGPPYRLGASLEAGRAWRLSEVVELGDLLFGGTVFAALDTPIGPIHAGWAFLHERPPSWFFRVGPVF